MRELTTSQAFQRVEPDTGSLARRPGAFRSRRGFLNQANEQHPIVAVERKASVVDEVFFEGKLASIQRRAASGWPRIAGSQPLRCPRRGLCLLKHQYVRHRFVRSHLECHRFYSSRKWIDVLERPECLHYRHPPDTRTE